MIILTIIKYHTIFYAYTKLLDKYCEKGAHNYKCNFINDKLLRDIVFPFGHEGHLNTGKVFSHSDVNSRSRDSSVSIETSLCHGFLVG